MNFVGFADDTISFEPTKAVDNIARSPLYQPAQFPNGYGQFGDQMQRAAFWNQMDRDHSWHVRMAAPRVAQPGRHRGPIWGAHAGRDVLLFHSVLPTHHGTAVALDAAVDRLRREGS